MTMLLGIETSCDETAAAVVAEGRTILSNVVASQIELHRRYGGVFPEIASRQHVLAIVPVIEQALAEAGVDWSNLDAVAVTEGPGLAGSLLVGVNAAKGIAFARDLPLVGVNHLEGHVYSNWLVPRVRGRMTEGREVGRTGTPVSDNSLPVDQASFPLLVLIVSGGHTELLLMQDHGRYRRLGGTLDDAAGEAFDKVARLLGLPYPGGPVIQRVAEGGDPKAFDLPRALTSQLRPEQRYDFSFSGLKTATLRLIREQRELSGDDGWPIDYAEVVQKGENQETDRGPQLVRDVAASFQAAVADVLVTKLLWAVEDWGVGHVCVCGGVAANQELRRQLAERMTAPYSIPPIWLCTDNAAMIAAAGHFRFVAGLHSGWDLDVRARLPLTSWTEGARA